MPVSCARPELPISAYGAIGNLRSVALVGRHGSVDWCCFPHLAAPSVFGALLDRERGGHFLVAPTADCPADQHYLEDSNVLCTRWRGERGVLRVTDFMPLAGGLDEEVPPLVRSELHRLLVCESGSVEVAVEWAPRMDYARGAIRMERVTGGYLVRGGGSLLTLSGLPEQGHALEEGSGGPCVRARFRLHAGQRMALITQWEGGPRRASLAVCEQALEETLQSWRQWVRAAHARVPREWAGPCRHLITRSELTLKLLTFSDTGAIAAAATTSLPETLGGVRNWDYRYAWIRDAGLTAQALTSLGHPSEAFHFLQWAEETAAIHGRSEHHVQIMYGLHGEAELEELELEHLAGYAGSRPVRIGNGAATQAQHDIYGELLTAAYELVRHGVALPPRLRQYLSHAANAACRSWEEPDHGLWEVRGEPRHYTHSKLMCWAGLDRARRLARQGLLHGPVERWEATAMRIRSTLLREGYAPELGSFVQAFGSRELDASCLLIALQELLPGEDERVQGTLDRVLEHLTEEGLVYRYRMDDGLPGEEGAFGLTTLWLVDALALSGRREEAEQLFEGLVRRASPLGLYAEQVDPRSGRMLGNFPQAFTHLGLVNSALYLAYARGEELPGPPLLGTREHREAEGLGVQGEAQQQP